MDDDNLIIGIQADVSAFDAGMKKLVNGFNNMAKQIVPINLVAQNQVAEIKKIDNAFKSLANSVPDLNEMFADMRAASAKASKQIEADNAKATKQQIDAVREKSKSLIESINANKAKEDWFNSYKEKLRRQEVLDELKAQDDIYNAEIKRILNTGNARSKLFEKTKAELEKTVKAEQEANRKIKDNYIKEQEAEEQWFIKYKNDLLKKELAFEDRKLKAKENSEKKSNKTIESIAKKQADYLLKLEEKRSTEERKIHQKALDEQIRLMKSRTATNREELAKMMSDSRKIQANAVNAQSNMARSASGVMSSETGTSFGHKFLTTAEYAAAGAGIMLIANSVRSTVSAVVEADKAMTQFKAILEMTDTEAKNLSTAIYDVGTKYGGSIEEYNKASIALGRAGLKSSELAEGMKIAGQMSLIAGDSIDNVTEMLASWKTIYPEEKLTDIADAMTAVSNESLASIDGIKTMTSYTLAMGNQAGLSANALLATIGAMKNLGKADSIVGTETRRLFEQIIQAEPKVAKAYHTLGVDIKKVGKLLREATDDATRDEVWKQFYETIGKANKSTIDGAIKGLQLLDMQTVVSTTKVAKAMDDGRTSYEKMFDVAESGNGKLTKSAEKLATSYEGIYERIVNSAKSAMVDFEQAFKDGLTGGKENIEEINKTIEDFDKAFGSAMQSVGSVAGNVAKLLIPVAENLDYILGTIVAFKSAKGILSLIEQVQDLGEAIGDAKTVASGLKGVFDVIAKNKILQIVAGLAAAGIIVYEIIDKLEKQEANVENLRNKYASNKLKNDIENQKKDIASLNKAIANTKKSIEKEEATTNNSKTIEALNKALVEHNKNLKEAKKNLNNLKGGWSSWEDTTVKKNNKKNNVNVDIGVNGKFVEEEKEKTAEQLKAEAERIAAYNLELSKIKELVTANQERYKSMKIYADFVQGMTDNDKRDIEALNANINKQEKELELTKQATGIANQELEIKKQTNDVEEARIAKQLKLADIYDRIAKQDISDKQKLFILNAENTMLDEKYKSLIKIANTDIKKTYDTESSSEIKALQESLKLETDTTKQKEITNKILSKRIEIILEVMSAERELANARGDTATVAKYDLAISKAKALGTATESITNQTSKLVHELSKIEELKIEIKLQGFDDVSNGIASVINGFSDMTNAGTEYSKQLKILADMDQESIEYTKLKNKANQNFSMSMMDGAVGMTGAIGNFYDEDDKRKKKQMELQKVMHMAQMVQSASFLYMEYQKAQAAALTAIGIAAQSSPWTGFATAAAMAAMLASFGIMLSGSGGGSGSSKSITEIDKDKIEAEYTPITDRLDRQIELLENLDKKGTAGQIGVTLASKQYAKDYALFVNESLDKMHTIMWADWGQGTRGATEDALEKLLGFDLANTVSSNIFSIEDGRGTTEELELYTTLNRTVLQQGENFMKLVEAFNTGIIDGDWLVMLDKGWNADGLTDPIEKVKQNIENFTNDYQAILSEFTLALMDNSDDLFDASEDFKEYFDGITGIAKYELGKIAGMTEFERDRLQQAFNEVDALRGDKSVSQYLKDEVTNIQALKDFMTSENLAVLISEDPTQLSAQLALVRELEEQTGITFENGAKGALDYLESIELVSEALITSRENIKDYLDSFKDEQQLAEELASSLGVSLATTTDGLQALFDNLSGGIEGLSDAELDLLTTNKALIESEKELIESEKELAETRINSIKDYISGLYSDDENLALLSSKFGVNIATNVDELATIFERLAYDADGLTTEEIKLLDLNKAKLANTEALQTEVDSLNESLSKTSESISSMESVFESLQDTIKELRVSGQEPSKTLSDFMNSIVEARDLLAKDDYEAYAKKVSDIVGDVGILDNSSLFGSKYDMEFAKARTAVELESLEDLTMDEIDYLKQIEENTRAQVDVLVQSMNNLGQSINSSLASKTTSSNNYIETTGDNKTSNVLSILSAYKEVLGRNADSDGINTWLKELNSGNVTQDTLKQRIAESASAFDVSNYTGSVDNETLLSSIANANKWLLNGFATGGYTGNLPTNAMAGIVHGQEYVVNAQTTRDLGLNSNSNVFSELLQEVKVLRQDNQAMKGLMTKLTADNHKMLTVERALYSESVA